MPCPSGPSITVIADPILPPLYIWFGSTLTIKHSNYLSSDTSLQFHSRKRFPCLTSRSRYYVPKVLPWMQQGCQHSSCFPWIYFLCISDQNFWSKSYPARPCSLEVFTHLSTTGTFNNAYSELQFASRPQGSLVRPVLPTGLATAVARQEASATLKLASFGPTWKVLW